MQFNAYFLLDEASLDPDIVDDNAPEDADGSALLTPFTTVTTCRTFDHLCETVEATLTMFFKERMYDDEDKLCGRIDDFNITAIASRRFNRTRVDDFRERKTEQQEGWFDLFEAASAECPWLEKSSVKALSEMKPKAIEREIKRMSKAAVKLDEIKTAAALLDLIPEVHETGLAGFMSTPYMRDFEEQKMAFDLREFLEVTDPSRKGLSDDAVIVRVWFHL